MVHIEQKREGDSLVELLPLPRPEVEGEPLQLQRQNLGQTIQPVAFLCRDLVAAARALVRVVAFQSRRAQVLEEGLLDGLVCLALLELVLDRQLQVAELVLRLG